MRVVLDSNVLLVAIGRKSRYRPIWDSFLEGNFKLIISEDIIHEYEEIFKQHIPGAAKWVFEILVESPDVIFQHIYYTWNAISGDPDDNKFFDVAVAAAAQYLVTDDSHFNEAKRLAFPKMNIISAEDFLNIVRGRASNQTI
ncbi:MAG TPA: putative toxin-antitoxin system toxin component, PIN family [Puia sp.]|nr:putative toxin-antitoxin system toxin component, PIN family [Puia sp.]